MRVVEGEIFLSPSDLMRFQGCVHATALDLRKLCGEPLEPAPDERDVVVVQRRGDEHERRHLKALRREMEVVAIARTDFVEAAAATRQAMSAGVPVIYQGALAVGRWQGWSDFLERVEHPSALGRGATRRSTPS